jgi:Rad3-related DNA helicase
VLLTSATLAVAGRFEFLKQRLGISAATERVLPPEFDFLEQAVLYIPTALPDVRQPAFAARAAEEITLSCWKYRRAGRSACSPATRRCAISTSGWDKK